MDSRGNFPFITDWIKKISGFHGKNSKGNWIILLCLGLILMIIAAPSREKTDQSETPGSLESFLGSREESQGTVQTAEQERSSEPYGERKYEEILEARVKEVLSQTEGVGQVDVLIVLKSSGQKIYQKDERSVTSSTREQDSAGGNRDSSQEEQQSTTVILGGGQDEPLLESELLPEISGIVISAQGGDNPSIQAEITEAMEALFGLPAHKIKVLKRKG
ncbi:MAG TPA: stage III sporulation protein AG [Candidatus Cottocaccamicrobium excrementipullorum]|nr:stage III sporulation protein AG [Candidatus Cottocaccamicrobium excrementipullorum]